MKTTYTDGVFTIEDNGIVSHFNQSHYMKIYNIRKFGITDNEESSEGNQVISHELTDRVVWREIDADPSFDIYPHSQKYVVERVRKQWSLGWYLVAILRMYNTKSHGVIYFENLSCINPHMKNSFDTFSRVE